MKIRQKSLVIMTVVTVVSILSGCTYLVTTDWIAEIPFDQDGTVQLFIGQEKPYPGFLPYPYGTMSVELSSPGKIRNLKLITSDIKLKFIKNNLVIKEQKLFPEPYSIDERNRITGVISMYNKYITPHTDKQYSLNWDEFTEALKISDTIECSIILEFEVNGQLYSIQKVGELKKDVKREMLWGVMYE